MNTKHNIKVWIFVLSFLALAPRGFSQVTYSDSFNTNVNYLTNGLTGTIWDGVYFGAGEFNNTGLGGGGPGATVQCDANVTAASTLTLQTTGTAWENADDDGFYLFKVVPGDFSMSVHVVSPYNNSGYNTAGLQARAFAADGDALGGSEDYVSWTRFDEFNFANYLRSEVNGGVTQINPGGYPNTNYWLRIDRVNGTNFLFYQKATKAGAWVAASFPAPVNGTTLRRLDLAGLPLQVGIIHATFAGQLGVQFTDFSLIESNVSFAAVPPPATGLTLTTNAGALSVSWTPGAGSAGSLVAVWTGTNQPLKEMPANGFTYTGNANYGFGSTLPGANYFVVYNGSGTNVLVGNLLPITTYNVAVYSYAGSGNTTAYSHTPATGSYTIPPNQVWAQVDVQSADVSVAFSANPGKWYWLQYSDSLNPANWQNVVPGPVLANGQLMNIIHAGGASVPQRFYRLQQVDPQFALKTSGGGISSLQRTADAFTTEYISGGTLGNVIMRYQPGGSAAWNTVRTATPSGIASVTNYTSADGTQYISRYIITSGLTGQLILESVFTFQQDGLLWSLNLTNLASQTVTVGDLALPLPMNTSFSGITSSTMKHSFISGYDSFNFWMRPDSVPPFLLMTPDDQTKLEFWDVLNGYEVYIHSYVAGTNAAAQYPSVTTQGQRWRQPNTSLALASGAAQNYGFKFQWVDSYDAIRQALVDNGKIDVHVVPGMTVPTNLFAQIALNTTQAISSVTAEFPSQTQIQLLGNNGNYHLYQVQFGRLGENELTVNYGNSQTMYLEFFVTEPLETLIKKRAAYLVSHQIITNKWYSGLLCDINMNDGVMVTPDTHDTLGTSFQVYEIASDDAGESRPAYLALKESVFPVQSEVSALDYYITNFVWGGLQRATNETFSYAIYGVPDWHYLRTNNSLSIGRGYDYPHIIVMYYGMYRVAKYHPEITTALTANTYLQRAWGTAMAMWSYGGGQATHVGLMNEVVMPDLIDDLVAEGMTSQAASLRTNWETKVNYYVTGNADLFASEYAFDSTGFESQQAYARCSPACGIESANGFGQSNGFSPAGAAVYEHRDHGQCVRPQLAGDGLLLLRERLSRRHGQRLYRDVYVADGRLGFAGLCVVLRHQCHGLSPAGLRFLSQRLVHDEHRAGAQLRLLVSGRGLRRRLRRRFRTVALQHHLAGRPTDASRRLVLFRRAKSRFLRRVADGGHDPDGRSDLRPVLLRRRLVASRRHQPNRSARRRAPAVPRHVQHRQSAPGAGERSVCRCTADCPPVRLVASRFPDRKRIHGGAFRDAAFYGFHGRYLHFQQHSRRHHHVEPASRTRGCREPANGRREFTAIVQHIQISGQSRY